MTSPPGPEVVSMAHFITYFESLILHQLLVAFYESRMKQVSVDERAELW